MLMVHWSLDFFLAVRSCPILAKAKAAPFSLSKVWTAVPRTEVSERPPGQQQFSIKDQPAATLPTKILLPRPRKMCRVTRRGALHLMLLLTLLFLKLRRGFLLTWRRTMAKWEKRILFLAFAKLLARAMNAKLSAEARVWVPDDDDQLLDAKTVEEFLTDLMLSSEELDG
jgi:hypothetical protein